MNIKTDGEWRASAACNGMDADLFFPNGKDWRTIAKALETCHTCPVAAQCANDAWQHRRPAGVALTGIWGGLYLTGGISNGRPTTITLAQARKRLHDHTTPDRKE